MRRKRIRVVSFAAALVLALAAFGLREHIQKDRYNRLLMLTDQQSMTELAAYLQEISDSLSKTLYCSTTPLLSNLAAKLWSEASCAKMSISHLGDGTTNLPGTYKFLSQVGDYTLYLSEKAAKGEKIDENEYDLLRQLCGYAKQYAQQAAYMTDLIGSNSFSFRDADLAMLDKSFESVSFSSAMTDAEKNVSDYPTLIYDGPFADNLSEKTSFMLQIAPQIDEQTARETARALLNTDLGNIETVGEDGGNLPSYVFSYGDMTVAVTKYGGKLRYLLSGAYAGESTVPIKKAIENGRAFLESIGYPDMRDNYYAEADGIATINFVYTADGVTCYPDLIKVGVALDTGAVVSFDATGYLMNHRERSFAVNEIDIDACRRAVSPYLTVGTHQPALIPTDGGDEVLTVEFLCRSEDGTDVLVYIDPETMLEENILLLTYSDNGILTR